MQPKVLVVDDLSEIQNILRRYLERAGFQVVCAGDGMAGVTLAESEQPDLILLDLSLPTIDGQQTAERIRALNSLRHVPILAMSGQLEDQETVTLFDGYIAKPFDLSRLVETIRSYLRASDEGEES